MLNTMKNISIEHYASAGLILIALWYELLYLLTISSSLSMYTFLYCSRIFVNLVRQNSDKFHSSNKFPFIVYWILFNTLIYCKTCCPDLPVSCLVYDQTSPKFFAMHQWLWFLFWLSTEKVKNSCCKNQ